MSKPNDLNKEHDETIREELQTSGMAFNRKHLTHPHVKDATKMVEEHARQDFNGAYAQEMEANKRDRELWDHQADTSRDDLHKLEEQKRATKSHLKVSVVKGTGENNRIPFWEWDLKDQLTFVLTIPLMVLVLCAGSGNVFSAIMAEADPVFLERPILAVLLACLLPAGSVALHSLGDLLESDRSRGRYTRTILWLTLLVLLAWAVLFGLTFQIGDDAIDWDELESQPDHTVTAFTIVQILAEMLCGTSLALIAGHIHHRYHADTTIPNPEDILLGESIRDRLPGYEAIHERRKAAWGRWMQLQAMREVHAQEMVALFLSLRRRFDDLNPM